jgi:tetratricopeptide (TPR) repeat protein
MATFPESQGSKPYAAPMARPRWPARLAWALAVAIPVCFAARTAWHVITRPDPDQLWRQAEAHLSADRISDAQVALRRLTALRSPTIEDWLLRAQVSNAEGRDDQALEALKMIPDEHALAAQAHHMAGRIERKHHRVRPAELHYRTALELDPRLIAAHRELIYIYGMQLRRHELDQEFKALQRLTQLTHHDLFTWGLTHFTVWGPSSADELESFIEADPLDRYSRLALATMLFDQPSMESRVERILEPLAAADPEAAALRIEMKLNHGHVDEALALLKDTSGNNPQLARLRGRAALAKGDLPAAIRFFADALSVEPFDRVSLSELGKALLIKGDKAGAKEYMDRVKRLDDVYKLVNRVSKPDQENQAPDLMELGKACEAAGLRDEARGWYTLAISRNPLDAEAQRALGQLRESDAVAAPLAR